MGRIGDPLSGAWVSIGVGVALVFVFVSLAFGIAGVVALVRRFVKG